MTNDLYEIADELRALANTGLRYARDTYDRARYAHALELSARLVALREGRDPGAVLAEYAGHFAHLSPLVGADAAVMRGGALLLIQRADNGLWAMPGGLAEVGETVAQAAERELFEETGLRGKASRLLGVFDSRRVGTRSRMHLYHVVMALEAEGELPPAGGTTPNEVLSAGWFAPGDLPPLHHGHDVMVPRVLAMLSGELPAPHFDPS